MVSTAAGVCMTLDDLLGAIEADVAALQDRDTDIHTLRWRDDSRGVVVEAVRTKQSNVLVISKAELRKIITERIKTPFEGNEDEWEQGYDIGRISGLADGEDKAQVKFAAAVDAIRACGEQFAIGRPWTVVAHHAGGAAVVSNDGQWHIAHCQHASDAQGIADVLNACIETEAHRS